LPPFDAENDHFAKTGSGQTEGKHSNKRAGRFLAAAMVLPIVEMVALCRSKGGEEIGAKNATF
jgi:hypothetical protein